MSFNGVIRLAIYGSIRAKIILRVFISHKLYEKNEEPLDTYSYQTVAKALKSPASDWSKIHFLIYQQVFQILRNDVPRALQFSV